MENKYKCSNVRKSILRNVELPIDPNVKRTLKTCAFSMDTLDSALYEISSLPENKRFENTLHRNSGSSSSKDSEWSHYRHRNYDEYARKLEEACSIESSSNENYSGGSWSRGSSELNTKKVYCSENYKEHYDIVEQKNQRQKNIEEYKKYATFFGSDNLYRKRESDLQSFTDEIQKKTQTTRPLNTDSKRDNTDCFMKSTESNLSKFSRDHRNSQEKIDNKSVKYEIPQLFSTKAEMQRKLNIIDKTQVKNLKDISDLTPKSKAHVVEKISKSLNFPLEKKLYKNLTPININDSMLGIKMDSGKENGNIKKYANTTSRDPVPKLTDFLTPVPPLYIPFNDQIKKIKIHDDKDVQMFRQMTSDSLQDSIENYYYNGKFKGPIV